MEKGKSKANGSREKEPRAKSTRDLNHAMNSKGKIGSQDSSHKERRMNDQLTTFQDSSRRCEGRSFLGSDMFEDPFFKDHFFTQSFGEPFKSSGHFGLDGIFNRDMFDMGRWPGNLLEQFQINNPPSIFQSGRSVPIEGGGGGGRKNVEIEELSKHHDSRSGELHRLNQEPIIEHPDDHHHHDNRGLAHYRPPHFNSSSRGPSLPNVGNQGNSYSFYSSSVMCAGSDGPHYASQTTRRQGPNGVVEEEHQEKDGKSGRASHRVSHGLGEKGHSLVRERKKDGREEKFETLHNIVEDEVPQFENEWERAAEKNLPKWPNTSSPQLGSNSRSEPRHMLPPGGSSHRNQY